MQVAVPAPVNEVLLQARALTVGDNVDPDPLRLIEVDFVVDPSLAVSFTVCDDTTAATIAVKLTLVAPEGTVIDAGTVMAVLLLARFTRTPVDGAAELSFTVQTSLPAPISVGVAQLKLDSEDDPDPLPCSFTEVDVLVVLPLLMAVTSSCPVESVVDPGSKRTWAVRLWPESSVAGSVTAFTLKALLELVS